MAIDTVSETIEKGRISTYLSANDNAKGGLFGPRLASPGSAVTIALVTDALYWGMSSQTTQDVRQMSNYLIWLVGKYGQQAQAIIDSGAGGGGTVIPGGNVTMAAPLDWIVGATATATAPLATGESTVTFDGTNGFPDLRGYNMDFFRGGQPQYTTDPENGATFYYWNKVSGVFICYGNALEGEQMRISPI